MIDCSYPMFRMLLRCLFQGRQLSLQSCQIVTSFGKVFASKINYRHRIQYTMTMPKMLPVIFFLVQANKIFLDPFMFRNMPRSLAQVISRYNAFSVVSVST